MVDPASIPPRPMTKPELEWWILFGICVAGKGAKQTANKLNDFLAQGKSAFGYIRWLNVVPVTLEHEIRNARFGQYKRISRAFRAAINLDLDNLSVESLEAIPGIGPKTARMIMMYGFPDRNLQIVPLDTHILKFLREQGIDAPKSTPPKGRKYLELEKKFCEIAQKRGILPRELDTEVWNKYARK